jgi:hypothetical protein
VESRGINTEAGSTQATDAPTEDVVSRDELYQDDESDSDWVLDDYDDTSDVRQPTADEISEAWVDIVVTDPHPPPGDPFTLVLSGEDESAGRQATNELESTVATGDDESIATANEELGDHYDDLVALTGDLLTGRTDVVEAYAEVSQRAAERYARQIESETFPQ